MYQKWSIRIKVASISLGLEDVDEVKLTVSYYVNRVEAVSSA